MNIDDKPDEVELRAIARHPLNIKLNRELQACFDRQKPMTPMSLPTGPQSRLDVRPIDWAGLPRRYMNPGELEVLITLVRSVSPRHVIEIGVNAGRTAKAILANVPGIECYTGIDVPLGYVPEKAVQRYEVPANPGELVKDDPRFHLVVRPRGSLDLTPQDLPLADAVFIDGDHGRVAVEHDSALAGAIVRPGGIIIWHDYHDLGTVDVKPVLDALHRDGRDIVHVEGTWLAFERLTLAS
jgi:predicted O-methyltransferase YrrM